MNIPQATYRIQFNTSFGFQKAAGIVEYLSKLGISDLFASPIFEARKASTHGYDVVRPNRLNPQLGSWDDFQGLVRALQERRMGWLQDIVPNHMAFDYNNRMLMDVLEHGRFSEYADYFDIEWDHPLEHLKGKLLAPFLGKHFAECLTSGEIRLSYAADGFAANYYNLKMPLRMETYRPLLTRALEEVSRRVAADDPDYLLFVDSLEELESVFVTQPVVKRREQAARVKNLLWDLACRSVPIRESLDKVLRRYNRDPSNPADIPALGDLLMQQVFQLSHWKLAGTEINYRRFFDINELIALRQDCRSVFEHTHGLLLRLIRDRVLTGVRIDHIDGLAKPKEYLERLKQQAGDTYVVVEKILGPHEEIPGSWPVQGTTGYDFSDRLNGIFVQQDNEPAFTAVYTDFSSVTDAFEQIVYHAKRHVLESQFNGDLDILIFYIKQISGRNRYGVDAAMNRLKDALTEMIARFPVYRTYLTSETSEQEDRIYMQAVTELAVLHRPELRRELHFLKRLLLFEFDPQDFPQTEVSQDLYGKIVQKFQQLTATLMAKGFEDTALYTYNRLLSLNEVGGDPGCFGCRMEEFHHFMHTRARKWPYSMNATSTHDSKRGEDVRARLNVLSEMPEMWRSQLQTWHEMNRSLKKTVEGLIAPDKNEEYFIYQTLLGVWPADDTADADLVSRIQAYMLKALREAKVHSSWLAPDPHYEASMAAFIENLLDPASGRQFISAFLPFGRKIAWYGLLNSISQCLIKITAPGVPDFYQGTEMIELTLVDPDNRRAVDFQRRARSLENLREGMQSDRKGLIRDLTAQWIAAPSYEARIKLFLTAAALDQRRANLELYRNGDYVPLPIDGRHRQHVIAFGRRLAERWSITITPRFMSTWIPENQLPLGEALWQDTAIVLPQAAPQHWNDALTEDKLESGPSGLNMGKVLNRFPAALLIGGRSP